uniref:Organ specific protein n=1 Tax=Opuntia streptacantha TaxID=393608 RepID=A0A7C9E858_OPUST
MEFNIGFSYIFLFSLLLLVSARDGRKDLGKYWEEMMKGQAMPEAIKGLINLGPYENVEVKEYGPNEKKIFIGDFDPRPNIPLYHDDVNSNEVKSTNKDYNSHHDGPKPKDKKPYMDDFEPRPNLSVYSD